VTGGDARPRRRDRRQPGARRCAHVGAAPCGIPGLADYITGSAARDRRPPPDGVDVDYPQYDPATLEDLRRRGMLAEAHFRAHSPPVSRGRRPQRCLWESSGPDVARSLADDSSACTPSPGAKLARRLQVIRKCWGRLEAGAGVELATYALRRVCPATRAERLSFRSTPRNFGEGLGLATAASVQGLRH